MNTQGDQGIKHTRPGLIERVATSQAMAPVGLLADLASGVPGLGSCLAAFVSAGGAGIGTKRLERLIGFVNERVSELDERRVDAAREFLESERGQSFLFRTFRNAFEASYRDQERLNARILLQAATFAPNSATAEEFSRVIATLSEAELRVASAAWQIGADFFHDPAIEPVPLHRYVTAERVAPLVSHLALELVDSYLKRIEGYGLVRELTGGIVGYPGGSFYITQYFRQLMEFLERTSLLEETLSTPPSRTGERPRSGSPRTPDVPEGGADGNE